MKSGFGLVLLAVLLTPASNAADLYELTADRVELQGTDLELTRFQGRDALKIKRGRAVLAGAALGDGTIEFDMWVEGTRAFAYVQMRLQSDTAFEEIYFRPHKSSLPDAAQYSPVFQRRSSWQLYHGPGGTAPVALPSGQWIPVKVELSGKRMALTVAESESPALVVDTLGHEPAAGAIAFRGFVPGNSDAAYAAYFSNVRIDSRVPEIAEPEARPVANESVLTRWQLSDVFEPEGPLSAASLERRVAKWTEVSTEGNGVLEFFRHLQIPAGQRSWAAIAQVSIHSPSAQTCQLHLGYSDEILVGLEGKPLLYANASYSFDEPRRQGLLHPEQAVVFLPLKRGKQTLSAVVADRFGGWGLYGRLDGCADVKVTR